MRTGLPQTHTILNTTSPDSKQIKWEITSVGIYDEDYGVNYIRLTHKLTADILPTDIVTFDLSFDSESAAVEKTSIITEDSVRCEVKQNTQDTDYWLQEAYDGYWYNDLSASTWTWAEDAYSSQDWEIPEEDDSDNEVNYFCQPYTQLEKDADSLLYDYACKSI